MKFKYKKTFKINSFAEETFEVIYDDVKEFIQLKEAVEQMHETSKKMQYLKIEENKLKRLSKDNPCKDCLLYDDCFKPEKDKEKCKEYDTPF